MLHRRPSSASKRLARCAAVAVAICSVGCAGTPTTDSVPLCPLAGLAEAEGWEVILDTQEDVLGDDGQVVVPGDKRLDAFVSYFEELHHYCNVVLPAWRNR